MDKVVFVDRDGVLNKEVHHLIYPNQLELIFGVKLALKILKDNGYKVIVITNQSVIARGLCTEELFHIIMKKLNKLTGNKIYKYFFCPHLPEDNCECRKPKSGLIFKASKDLKIDPKGKYFIGDTQSDMDCGKEAGCITIGVRTGHNSVQNADFICDDLLDAVRSIICKE